MSLRQRLAPALRWIRTAPTREPIAARFGLEPTGLDGVLLQPVEIEAIANEILARPGCALLVFGCGHDSRFWERVNQRGTTVFLEDHPEWAATVAATLTSSVVHQVSYGTTRTQWRELLDDPSNLAMPLPPEVRDRRWDVVLVDGPAGFDDSTPGRMKSIYEAARLVAPGGRVIVHDCERPVEDAYTTRYLGTNRLVLEIHGHALLRGYAF